MKLALLSNRSFSSFAATSILLISTPANNASAMIHVGNLRCQERYVMGQFEGIGNCMDMSHPGIGGGVRPPGGGIIHNYGGGGISAWVQAPGRSGVHINLAKKEVKSSNLTCSDELVLRQNEMQAAVLLNPYLKIKNPTAVFTYRMPKSGQTQKFWRTSSSGSLQMEPITGCQ